MKYTEDNFPLSTIQRNGMKILQAHIDETSCMTICDVVYREV